MGKTLVENCNIHVLNRKGIKVASYKLCYNNTIKQSNVVCSGLPLATYMAKVPVGVSLMSLIITMVTQEVNN